MDSFIIPIFSAFWLGILTSISPCPLATNIAAISYISRDVENKRSVLLSGILYTLGRLIAYLILGIILVTSLLSISELSIFLQKYMNRLLGPVLIIAGMFLLELIRIIPKGSALSETMQNRISRWGKWGAFLLGILFALSFCPVSAALFFGSLIPLAVKHNSSYTLPAIYGLGTGLPVFIFAILISIGSKSISKIFTRLTNLELWFRRITGIIFILVGIYYTLTYNFNITI